MRDQVFGSLLKRYRRAAHLTQADLAERVGYSSHYVSMLERGVRSAQPLTVDLLADALTLDPAERAALHAAAAAHTSPATQLPGIVPSALPLIGRERDIARTVRLLKEKHVRLLTLTGPGGVGKTALAQHVGAMLAPTFREGGVFIDLTAVRDPDDVLAGIAQALTLREIAGRSLEERLLAFLQEREILLVLDGFERVVDAAPALGELLAQCASLKALVTSRVPLRLRAELEYRVQPLVVPEGVRSATELLQTPAVALFVQRAAAARHEPVIDEAQAEIVTEICRKVDGLPLAIELAAARMTHLPLTALRDRLDHRLHLLTGGARDLPARQQRMRDTIAWSYDLLPSSQQSLFRQLSVFAGSWSLEAAEDVCAPEHPDSDVLDGLRILVDSSLVTTLGGPFEPRYRMLDTIHEYARDQLIARDELVEMQRRHSKYYVHLAEQAEPALQDRDQHIWYARLQREQDNLRAALAWLLSVGDAESALRLCGAVWRFWQRHGDVREGRRWLEESLALGNDAPADVRARALWGASWLAYYQGDHARTRALSAEHLALALEQGDALSTRNALTGLGMAAIAEGRYQEAVSSLQQALDLCLPLGNIWHRATSFLNLGTACLLAGDLERATQLFQEAHAQFRERGDEVFVARVVQHLGYIALLRGELGRARKSFIESLQALHELGERPGVADGLEAVAALAAETGDPERASMLVGAAARLREEIGVMPLPALRALWHPVVDRAEEALGEAGCTAAWNEGRGMSLEEAVVQAAADPAN